MGQKVGNQPPFNTIINTLIQSALQFAACTPAVKLCVKWICVIMISTLATDKQVVRLDTSRMYRAGKHRFQFPPSRRQIGNQICCPSNGTNTDGLRAVCYSISGGIEHPKHLAQWRPDRFGTIIRSNERVDIRRRPLPPTPAATIFTEGRAAACAASAAGLNIKRWLRRRRLTSVIAGCRCCYYGCSLNFPRSDVWLSRTLESLLCRLVFPPELTSPNAVTFVQYTVWNSLPT